MLEEGLSSRRSHPGGVLAADVPPEIDQRSPRSTETSGRSCGAIERDGRVHPRGGGVRRPAGHLHLNVVGEEAVLTRRAPLLGLLWTDRAIAYRRSWGSTPARYASPSSCRAW